MHAGGQRFESVILHLSGRTPRPFIDMLEQKKRARGVDPPVQADDNIQVDCTNKYENTKVESKVCARGPVPRRAAKGTKGARRMPGLWKATKDAASCEKPGRGAGDL